jgi:hypothetical protein
MTFSIAFCRLDVPAALTGAWQDEADRLRARHKATLDFWPALGRVPRNNVARLSVARRVAYWLVASALEMLSARIGEKQGGQRCIMRGIAPRDNRRTPGERPDAR